LEKQRSVRSECFELIGQSFHHGLPIAHCTLLHQFHIGIPVPVSIIKNIPR
jgi:hypothetical protein